MWYRFAPERQGECNSPLHNCASRVDEKNSWKGVNAMAEEIIHETNGDTDILKEMDYKEGGAAIEPSVEVKILVVDDEEIMRDFLTDVLREENYQVFSAAGGAAALSILKEEAIEVVITDIMMPGMSGLEMLTQAKGIDATLDVIVMTGYASVESAVEAMKVGAADYITKPLNMDHVRIVLKKTVNKRRLESKAKESEFYKNLSREDGLTELFNHRFFQQLLAMEIARSERNQQSVSLIMMDIDNFKIFNDTNGHPIGDMALKKLSWLLKQNFRECDFVARYGGEEFAVILPETDKAQGIIAAKRICQIVNETSFEYEEALPQKKLTISAGVATYPADAANRKELIEHADAALYEAKRGGRNRVCAWPIT